MPSLLSTHLDQIALCSSSIAALPFPPPSIFTNALLSTGDITSLIRDTEPHERALFHLAPPVAPVTREPALGASQQHNPTARRATSARASARPPRKGAVAAVLGGTLYTQTRQEDGMQGKRKGEVDVEALLVGAEKLAAVYPISGVADRIALLRQRHQRLAANIKHYEGRVDQQTAELQAFNRPGSRDAHSRKPSANDVDDVDPYVQAHGATRPLVITTEDLRHEEDAIAELQRKKVALEERVAGMERDLGGLLR